MVTLDPASDPSDARPQMAQRAWALVAFLGLALLNLQLFGIGHPPLIDWPNHLARHGIQCAAPGYDGQAAYYDFTLALVPNLAGDLVHLLPWACENLLLTRDILVQWATTGFVAGLFVLHRAVWGHFSAWPLAGALASYPMVLSFGFENFLIAAAFVPWALALWLVLERRSLFLAALVFVPVMAGLYLLHLYAFGFLGAVLGGRALGRAWAGKAQGLRALAPVLALAAAGVLPLGHLAWLMAGAGGLEPGNHDYGDILQKLIALMSPAIPVTFALDPVPLRLSATLPLAVIVLGMLALRRAGHPPRIAPGWGAGLLAGLVLAAAMPFILGGIWYSDIRFPHLLAGLFVAVSDPHLAPRRMRVLVLVLLAVMGLRSASMEADWRAHDAQVRTLLDAARTHLTQDDRLASARIGLPREVYRHSNSAPLLGAVTGAHVPSLFQGANTLVARPEIGQRHVKQGLMEELDTLLDEAAGKPVGLHPYMRDWRAYYTHLLVLGEVANAPPVLRATLLEQAGWFRLYRLEDG